MLKFASTNEALQHLSDLTGKKIIVANRQRMENNKLQSSLYEAIEKKDKDELKKVLSNDVYIDDWGILQQAILTKDKEIIEMVIAGDADVKDMHVSTAIMETEDPEIVKILLKYGPDVKDATLMLAEDVGNQEIIDMIKKVI
jgi:hypothetical protein